MSDSSSSGTPTETNSDNHPTINIANAEKSAIDSINIEELMKVANNEENEQSIKKTIEIVIQHHHHHHYNNNKTSDLNNNVRKNSAPVSSPNRSYTASPHLLSNSNSINTSTSSQNAATKNGMSYKINSLNRLQANSSRHKRSSSSSSSSNSTYVALRNLSLQNLNAAQHFLLAMGRDISFIVPILGLINSIKKAWDLNMNTLQKYPDIEDMPNFYKTMFYIQQQDTKNLYLFWQHLFNNQIESYQNNTINLLQNWKNFMNYLNLTEPSLLNTTKNGNNNNNNNNMTINTMFHGNNNNSNSSCPFFNSSTNTYNSTNAYSNISQNSNSNNNISYNANDFKSLNDIRPSYLSAIIRGRSSEFLMCGLWCIVSMYLTYVTLDALMVRWITIYSTTAAILRMVSISLLLIIIELFILKTLSNEPIVSNGKNFKFGGENSLHAWIFISCVLTGVYIWQSFWTSFLQQQKRKNGHIYEEEKKEKDEINQQNGSIIKPFTTTLQFWKYTLKKHLDLYSIIVFAVVPVGFASFLTMIVLLRNLVIQRMDVEQLEKVWYEINKELLI